MEKIEESILLNLIKYPIITDKSTKLLEENQYSFAVDRKANKINIKRAIEYIFNVKVKKINTSNTPIKKKRVGKFTGIKTRYKKAIISLDEKDNINLFSDD
uniref:Large ribosomal subunit protein uL23c n=1 Tax=Caulacanthus okamurae TaxID=152008 RepID=A0A6H1U701_9FLOR|nr:50S ribosomal protein L23 [Caulacanthus okamurae]QIZ74662.1 50S ribosomal protein L23 [Caulacanthus okamurae]